MLGRELLIQQIEWLWKTTNMQPSYFEHIANFVPNRSNMVEGLYIVKYALFIVVVVGGDVAAAVAFVTFK